MKKLYHLFLLCVIFTSSLKGQVNLSVYSEISIITAGAGTNLYEAFGHSAIRIKDPVLNLDLIYNYGMFDFNAPNFYSNFTKGKLEYKLARYDFKYFLASYKKDKRWIKQQVLNLSQQEKQTFFMYLENNARPENANYLYDPFYNNCASKLRDITQLILGEKLEFKIERIEKNLSLRTLMNRRIHWNTWGGFGINLALGSKLDQEKEPLSYMYLPDYVYDIFKDGKNGDLPLVKKEVTILDFENQSPAIAILNPFLIFSILSLIGLWITYSDFKKNTRNKKLDFVLFFTTGIIGLLIVFLWFFTNHSTTPNNFNILWAFLPNIIIAFQLLKNSSKNWVKTYVKVLPFLLILLSLLWVIGLQIFPIAITPLLILLLTRYLFLSIKLK